MKNKFLKKQCKKIAAGVAVLLVADSLLVPSLSLTAKAQTNEKASMSSMVLDTGKLTPSDGKWSQEGSVESDGYWTPDYDKHDTKVWYGHFEGTATAFRVLTEKNGKLLLDCDTVLENCPFNNVNSNVYMGSALQKYIEGDGYYLDSSVLSGVEKKSIASVTLPAFHNYSSITDDCFMLDMMVEDNVQGMDRSKMFDGEAANQHVFLLSAQEVNQYYNIYKTSLEAAKAPFSNGYEYLGRGQWFTRTGLEGMGNQILEVRASKGQLYRVKPAGNNSGYSPAFYVNQSNILLASEMNKNKKTSVTSVGNTTGTNWKLTLIDSGKKVGIQSGKSVSISGSTVKVPYTSSGSGITQISVMITDKDRTQKGASILYYGAIATSSLSQGEATFTLPSGLPSGYKMYLIAEDVNTSYETDYASAPVDLSNPSDDPDPVKPGPVKGKTYTVNNVKYKVLNASTDGKGYVSVVGIKDTSKTSVTIPKKVKIKGYYFKITKIDDVAFKGCTKVKTITISATDLTQIGSGAFNGCTNLSKVEISSKGLNKIGKKAFYNCKKLANVKLNTTKLTDSNVGDSAFKSIKSTCHFDVPNAKIKAYKKLFVKKGASSKIVVD